jgi:hypothetical protein
VAPAEFVKAVKRICSQSPVEPEVDFSETFVPG